MASHDFLDVPDSHPFHTEISNLVNAGITGGCGVGTYCPDSPVTRAQMAAFLGRGLGRAAWAHTLYSSGGVPEVGQGSFVKRTVGTVTITTGGVPGETQFVSLNGKLSLYTNNTFAGYCTGGGTCGWRIDLIDVTSGAVLDDAIWRPRDDSDAATMSLHAVVAAPTATTRSYRMQIWYEGSFVTNTFTKYDFSLVAQTFPYGSTGGNVLGPVEDGGATEAAVGAEASSTQQ